MPRSPDRSIVIRVYRRAILALAAMGLVAACASSHAHSAASTTSTSPPAAASSSAPTPSPTGSATLTGNLEAVGGPAGASANPLPGSVTIAGPVTQHVTVGPDGTYTATVPPGTYTVTGTSPQYNDGAATCHTDGDTVTLTAGQNATADVLCQEK
jgi:hypothetical protein